MSSTSSHKYAMSEESAGKQSGGALGAAHPDSPAPGGGEKIPAFSLQAKQSKLIEHSLYAWRLLQ